MIELFLISLIAINTLLSTIYMLYHKKVRNSFNIPVFLLCMFIPVYGILLFAVSNFLVKRNLIIKNSIFNIDEEEKYSNNISDITNSDYCNTLPIIDVLEIKDIARKRKHAFNSVKGDFRKLYPFLEKVLKDDDPEVVHYASTAISDYRQKINENYSQMREMHINDPDNIKDCENYINAFLDLITWEEFNNSNTAQKRLEISALLNLYFSLAEKNREVIDKYYYIEKIKNEVIIENFKEAENTCIGFEKAYPDSFEPYLSRLEFCYLSGNRNNFINTLKQAKYKDIIWSKEANDMVLFWNNALKRDFRGAV